MPGFEIFRSTGAPIEEVWKLLHDHSRFPQWWAGVETVAAGPASDAFVLWLTGYPDVPLPQRLRDDRAEGRVTISCQVKELEFSWQLTPDGPGTAIRVAVWLPEREAHQLDGQRKVITRSLHRLADLAEREAQ